MRLNCGFNFCFLVLLFSFCGISFAENVPDDGKYFESGDRGQHFSAVQRDLAALVAPIKTEDDLAVHLEFSNFAWSPLHGFDPRDRKVFVESLVFGLGGIAGFDHDVFARVSPTEAYEILALFGVQYAFPHVAVGDAKTALDERLLPLADLLWNSCQVLGLPPGDEISGSSLASSCPGGNLDLAQNSKCQVMGSQRRCVSPHQGSTCRISTCR